MKRILIFSFLIFSLSIFCEEEVKQEEAKQEYELKYIYNKGETVSYSLKIENYERFKIGTQDMGERRRKTIIEFSQRVEDVDENGNGVIVWKYLKGSYNGVPVDIGGKEAILKIDKKGEIIESQGLQEASYEFFKIIQKSMADYIPGFDRLPVKIDFSKFNSNDFNSYWEAFRPVFPDKKVKIGESWEKEVIVPFIFRKGNIVYTLDRVEGNKAYIKMSLGRHEIKVQGDIIFDIEKGKLNDEDITIKAENFKEKIDFGQFTQYKQLGSYEISGTMITKVKLSEI